MPASTVPSNYSTPTLLAGAAAGALFLALVLAIRLSPADPAFLTALFTPEHIELLSMYDNRGQQWAHRLVLLSLAAFAAILWWWRPLTLPQEPPAKVARVVDLFTRHGGWLLGVAVIVAAILGRQSRVSDSFAFQGHFPLVASLSLRTQLAVAVLAFIALRAGLVVAQARPRLAQRLTSAALALFAAYVLALATLALLRSPDLAGFSPGLISGVEWHYSGSVGSADRFAAGQVLGEVPVHSGLLTSAALGAWQHAHGMLSFGGHIALIQVLQVVLMAICLAGYGRWYSWRAVPWLAASLLLLPWIQPLHAAVLYPNQSGWRFLGFCAGAVLLTLLREQRLRHSAPILGLAVGVALLWNLETGLCLAAACPAFFVLRTRAGAWREWLGAMAAYAGGILAALAAFAIFARVAQGAWPDVVATLLSLPLIGSFLGGYSGWAFRRIDPIAALMFVHALYVLLRGLLGWAGGAALEPREACRTALAALLVLWASYYIKGPDPWNLWSAFFIYGFLLEDLLPRPQAGGSAKTLARSAGVIAAVLIVAPAIVAANAGTVAAGVFAARQEECPPARSVSGICVAPEIATAMRDKAAALRERSQKGSLLYFTADTYLMPMMTGVDLPLRSRDVFSDTILLRDFDQLVADVQRIAPGCVLFDDPSSALSGYDVHRRFYGRLRAALATHYKPVATDRGWDVLCKV